MSNLRITQLLRVTKVARAGLSGRRTFVRRPYAPVPSRDGKFQRENSRPMGFEMERTNPLRWSHSNRNAVMCSGDCTLASLRAQAGASVAVTRPLESEKRGSL